jgi:zinc protease
MNLPGVRLMKHPTVAFIIIVAALLGLPGAPWMPRAAAMPIERVTGTGGIEAWLVEDHSIPVVTLRFAIAGGAALDPPGKAGTAAMAASLLDEGAGAYDSIAYHRRLDDLAGELSFTAGQDEFGGSLRMLKRNLAATAELLRVALAEPHFDADAVERIRGETIALLARQAHNPPSLAGRLWMRDAFEDHPYGKDSSGTAASVAAITRADLADFVARHVHRKGLVIGAVGDITAAELSGLIDQVFGGLSPGDQSGDDSAAIPEASPGDSGTLVVRRTAVPQSAVSFGQAGPKRDDPDWYAAFVLNDIIGGGGFRGRLMKEIRDKRGLAYGVSTGLVPYRHAGLILGSIATENSRVAESIALIRAEWQRMREDGPTEVELHDAQTYLAGSFPLSLDSTRHIAAVLVQMQLDKLGIDYLDRRPGLIGGVTLDEARAVARRLFDPAKLSFAVVGDPAGLETTRPAAAAPN